MTNRNKIVKIEFEYEELDIYYMILIYRNGKVEKKEITRQLYEYIIGVRLNER